MKSVFSCLYAAVKFIENNARIVTIVAMTAIVFIQVVARLIFKWSSPAMEEAARFIMIWSIFIGAVVSTREDNHIRMAGFARTPRGIALFNVLSKLVTFLFLCVFVKWSLDYALYSLKKEMNSIVLGVPMIVVHACFLVTGLLMSLHTFLHLVRQTRTAFKTFRETTP
ncbi:TRAP transporter small permease [Desulfospira joergensenii]|uniref:TRAP transporter small permease n=1 Tax=Desulfospira joergensenii TaxID=53329 RepID=UPI0003B37EF4|nr:TRAP transporter small permease subunit [Desulfospira joergensenii]